MKHTSPSGDMFITSPSLKSEILSTFMHGVDILSEKSWAKAHRLISVIEEGKFMDVRALQFSKSGNNDLSMPAIVKKPKGKKKMLRKRF